MELIRAEGLCKEYRAGASTPLRALQDVDLSIARGEFVAVMGQSGSGKSTLMNILGCLDVPTRGRYTLDGEDVSTLDDDRLSALRNRQIGFVFQGFNLLMRMNARDNVVLPMLYAGVDRAEARVRAEALLARLGLADFGHHLPNQLSGGQQQRVAIARALANHPKLILADEPTGNLDSQTSGEIMDLFRDLNASQAITVVVVTHEPDVAGYCDRVVRFKDGRIVADGRTRDLLARAPA